MLPRQLKNFALLFHNAAEKGILLVFAASLAIIIANSSLGPKYFELLGTKLSINVGLFELKMSVLHWINDLLMALFFLLVGVEIKREFLEGHLSTNDQRVLPFIAATGGVIFPMLIFYAFNSHDQIKTQGWAIPAATDIAFALGMLALVGRNFPISTRVFLTALAIIDDLAAVVIIAIFYTADLSGFHLFMIALSVIVLATLNKLQFRSLLIYLSIGLIMWYMFYKSGVHATIGGVILGWLIPLRVGNDNYSPLKTLEQNIYPLVSYIALPIFAFANSGIELVGLSLEDLFDSLTLGISFGLFLGKQIGVFLPIYFLIKSGVVKMPERTNMMHFYAVSLLCGIGFTMSLFIGLLAFDEHPKYIAETKLGVVLGSLMSVVGAIIVIKTTKAVKRIKGVNN